MTATETACRGLPIGEADDLRSKVTTILRNHKPPTPNISKEEREAIGSLRKDKNIKILPADKGKCTVILNTEDYMKKCKVLLNDSKTYEKLNRDPTQKYKKQLVAILKDLKDRGSIDDRTWRKMYPTPETPPKFYGLPKIHKQTMPMRPIVSSIDSITYTCAKHIAYIITPVVGNTSRHVKNSDQFSKLVRNFRVEQDQELRSYDVTALFTSVPVNKAVECIRRKLEADVTLKQRTDMSPAEICRLLELCLSCTYFVFDGQFYRQIHGPAMGYRYQ
jgi:uncharacterized protein YifE (UPF0438 family)